MLQKDFPYLSLHRFDYLSALSPQPEKAYAKTINNYVHIALHACNITIEPRLAHKTSTG